jgi:ABC-2 type transport system ATP-binding protein
VERAVIRLHGVSFSYDGRGAVLEGADLEIGSGLTLLLGPNGCGKSTLLKLAAGVERPDGGEVSIRGHDAWNEERAARKGLAYVPEQPDLTPYATVEEVLRLAARLRGEPVGAVSEALILAGLRGLEDRSIRELSMGQRRRAVLAAAMIGVPRIIILDEPLEAMDRAMRGTIIEWVGRHQAVGRCIVIATHDIEPFAAMAGRAVTVSKGQPSIHEPLPDGSRARLAMLEALARGRDANPASPGAPNPRSP